MDNLDPQDSADNLDPAAPGVAVAAPVAAPAETFSWKSKVGPDLSKAPSLGKFEDSPAGLAEM